MTYGARRAVLVGIAVVVLVAGCDRSSSPGEPVALDGSPRHPDAVGVVRDVSRREIRLESGKALRIDESVRSFASQTMEPVPLLQRKGQYVHIGVDDDRAVWVAAVGSVVRAAKPTVYYPGRVKRSEGREVVFVDGTVLTLAAGIDPPADGAYVVAEIDIETDEVRAIPQA